MNLLILFLSLSLISLVTTMIYIVFKHKYVQSNDSRNYGYYLTKLITLLVLIVLTVIFTFNASYFVAEPSTTTELTFKQISLNSFAFSFLCLLLITNKKDKIEILLEYPFRSESKLGNVELGRIFYKHSKKQRFFLNIRDLEQHMFVCGATGTGKSNFLQQFLKHFTKKYDIPFLLTEFKGEYHFLQNEIKDLLILKPRENFSINIFDPEGADAEIHAERVFKIFESGGLLENIEYSPQMERVFVDILKEVCPNEENRNWDKFFAIFDTYYVKEKDFTMKKSVDAIRNRIRRYGISTLKSIFDKKTGINVKDLFNYKVLLDLSSIIRLGGEKEDALFFLNMVLKYLWDKNIEEGSKNYEGIKHITIIEDAQYFAPQELSARTKLTSYIEDIALLLMGTGECLISLATRPNISREILANCGVLMVFQSHMQKDLMQELLNLKNWEKRYLSVLKCGQCIIRVSSIEKPFALKTSFIKRSWLSDEEIKENNKRILELKRKSTQAQSKIQQLEHRQIKTFCKFCRKEFTSESEYCQECSVKLENEDKEKKELEELINELVEKAK